MKVLKLIAVLVFMTIAGYSQTTPWSGTPTVTPQTRTLNGSPQLRWIWGSYLFSFPDTLATKLSFKDTVNTIATKYYASVASPKIPGDRPISSVPALNDNPGTNLTPAAWIIAEFYKSQPPTMSLSGGTSRERLPAGSDVIAVGWTAGRPASGAPITTIVVNGVNQSFASPAAGASVSGTQNVTVTRNTNITISGTASTAEPKSGSGSTTFSFYDKRYAGFDANALVSGKPAQADILAASFQDNNGTTAALTQTTAQQGSNKYYFYITTATISSVTINGIPSTASFNINIPITFTNAVGGTFSGYANVSVNQFGANAGGNTIVFN